MACINMLNRTLEPVIYLYLYVFTNVHSEPLKPEQLQPY